MTNKINLYRLGIACLAFMLVLVLGISIDHFVRRTHAQSMADFAIHNAFTIYTHTVLTDAVNHPEPFIGQRRIFAHRADGSTVSSIEDLELKMHSREILNAATNTMQKVADEVSAVSTGYYAVAELAPKLLDHLSGRDPTADCRLISPSPSSILGRLLGVEVWGTLRVVKTSEETVSQISYRAPALNCQAVGNDATFGDSHSQLVLDKVVTDTPDQNLFDVPAYYAELAPSQALTRQYEQLHKMLPAVFTDDRFATRLAHTIAKEDPPYYARKDPR